MFYGQSMIDYGYIHLAEDAIMIVTVVSFKGGVAKTTTSVHLATYFQQLAPTLLLDGDSNRSAIAWNSRGQGKLPFAIYDERQAAYHARNYEHVIIDTAARPNEEDLRALAGGCDLLVIPTTPDALSLDALLLTVDALQKLGTDRFRVLITMIPPKPSRDGDEARNLLTEAGIPLFRTGIRRLVAFQKAALHGVAVRDVRDERASDAWADYEAIGREVSG